MAEPFSLSFDEKREFLKKYGYSSVMVGHSGYDYVAARCLILNAFWNGFPLFSQAIEKMLKGFIFLQTGEKSKLKYNDRHNPYLLKQELSKYRSFSLDKYDSLLERLYGHYQQRYFDNQDQSKIMGISEIDEFDELWFSLFEQIPIPIELKYRNMAVSGLFEEDELLHRPTYYYWMSMQNKTFLLKEASMRSLYNNVKAHDLQSHKEWLSKQKT